MLQIVISRPSEYTVIIDDICSVCSVTTWLVKMTCLYLHASGNGLCRDASLMAAIAPRSAAAFTPIKKVAPAWLILEMADVVEEYKSLKWRAQCPSHGEEGIVLGLHNMTGAFQRFTLAISKPSCSRAPPTRMLCAARAPPTVTIEAIMTRKHVNGY